MFKFTYRGVEFSKEQVNALYWTNNDFFQRARMTNTETGEWTYLREADAFTKSFLGLEDMYQD